MQTLSPYDFYIPRLFHPPRLGHFFLFSPLSMALQPFGPWPLFQFLNPTHSRQDSLGEDQAVARPLPTHRINAHRHPCLEWDSKLRPQCSSRRRRFMPQTARLLWSADSVTTVVFIQEWKLQNFPPQLMIRSSSSPLSSVKNGTWRLWLKRSYSK
jgi:hypothetical protein